MLHSCVNFSSASLQNKIIAMDKVSNVVLDIECLTQPTELCCTGSPKMTVSGVFDIIFFMTSA